ncbi:MAG TPA: hypothetical protein VGB25_05910 [Candidatus Binatia bacterium]
MALKKGYAIGLGMLLTLVLAAGDTFAFSCPRLIKAAGESIAKAESKAKGITKNREKGRAMAMIELAKQWNKEAEADHKEAVAKKSAEAHYRSEAKAKAAKSLADMVK